MERKSKKTTGRFKFLVFSVSRRASITHTENVRFYFFYLMLGAECAAEPLHWYPRDQEGSPCRYQDGLQLVYYNLDTKYQQTWLMHRHVVEGIAAQGREIVSKLQQADSTLQDASIRNGLQASRWPRNCFHLNIQEELSVADKLCCERSHT